VEILLSNEDKVSIIIGCYNHAEYLSEAIQSAQRQTYPHMECIVVDDGSTDDTGSVVRKFPAVRYLRQENQGVSVARNKGLRESTGRYVLFLDGDDRLLPDAIERSLDCFRAHPGCACVIGRYHKIDTQGNIVGPANQICGQPDLYRALLQSNVVGMLATMLFERTAVEALGGFSPRFRASEDYDLALRIARDYPVIEHERLVAEYRWHDRNMSFDYGFLLKDVLDALRVQWPHVQGQAKYEEAYQIGVKNWRTHYSSLLFNNAVKETKRTGPLKPLQQAMRMVALNPATVPALARRAMNWVRS